MDKNNVTARIDRYLDLQQERPELFSPSKLYPLILDREELLRYQEENPSAQIGVVYESKFYMLVVDLIRGKKPYTYSRIVYANKSNGSVVVPYFVREGKEPEFGLLEIYRHPIRGRTGLEFPRGFATKGLTSDDNAVKELMEEFSMKYRPQGLETPILLGKISADGGLTGGNADVYMIKLTGEKPILDGSWNEGITDIVWLTESEVKKAVADNKITDGFTLSAFLMYLTKN